MRVPARNLTVERARPLHRAAAVDARPTATWPSRAGRPRARLRPVRAGGPFGNGDDMHGLRQIIVGTSGAEPDPRDGDEADQRGGGKPHLAAFFGSACTPAGRHEFFRTHQTCSLPLGMPTRSVQDVSLSTAKAAIGRRICERARARSPAPLKRCHPTVAWRTQSSREDAHASTWRSAVCGRVRRPADEVVTISGFRMRSPPHRGDRQCGPGRSPLTCPEPKEVVSRRGQIGLLTLGR